jgi:protein-L-isoaspartate(D-aspartate) O-methyltransferase
VEHRNVVVREDPGATGTGIVMRVKRNGERYGARVVCPVAIFPCVGGVDAEADGNLAATMSRLDDVSTVRSFRRDRHDRAPMCCLHGEGYCFSRLASS